jgi:glucokinase
MEKKYLGIDIGGTFIKLGIVDDAGNVSMRREVPIDRSGNKTVMETLMHGIDDLIAESGLDVSECEGIGVSAAGCIDTTKGCVAENGGNIPNWSFTSVAGPLSERYGIRATIANDGNCVALAEAWIGAAK